MKFGPSAMTSPLTIVVSGATGLVGRVLVQRLHASGHVVRRLVRGRASEEGDIVWDPARGQLDAPSLEGTDAVVHLAGEAIAHRWTAERKRAIRESRVSGTTLLAKTIASLERRPRVMVSASAVGFYGDRGDEPLDEASPRGRGFLADVVEVWERSADPAREAGIRVVHPRFGIVLAPDGGALERLLPIFSVGAGGRLGSGLQYMSWIARDDLLRAIEFVLVRDDVVGPANATAPTPVTNAEFSRTLGHVLHRPAVAAVPDFAAKLAYGQMAEETLLWGQRVLPQKLLQHGFEFRWPTLEEALRHELGR
jgi:uncharacterized protein (TIGR01777 family)